MAISGAGRKNEDPAGEPKESRARSSHENPEESEHEPQPETQKVWLWPCSTCDMGLRGTRDIRPDCPRCGTTTSELYPIAPVGRAAVSRRLLKNMAANGIDTSDLIVLPEPDVGTNAGPARGAQNSAGSVPSSENSSDLTRAYADQDRPESLPELRSDSDSSSDASCDGEDSASDSSSMG